MQWRHLLLALVPVLTPALGAWTLADVRRAAGIDFCATWLDITQSPSSPTTSQTAQITVEYGETLTQSPSCIAMGGPDPSSLRFTVNGTDVTSSFTATEGMATASAVPLVAGNNTLVASVEGHVASGDQYTQTDEVQLEVIVTTMGVSVAPAGASVTVRPGSATPITFSVQNTGSTNQLFLLAPTCAGAAADGPCLAVPEQVLLNAGQAKSAVVHYSAASSGTGSVQLRATRSGGSETHAGTTTVSIDVAPPPRVVVDSVNAGEAYERDLCLAISAGPNAAYECGDLRLVHTMPTFRTMNKTRAPLLLYNSQFARPVPLVAANVTMPAMALATGVHAVLVRSDGSVAGSQSFASSDWGSPGAVRRIVLPFTPPTAPSEADATIHSYKLRVTFDGMPGGAVTDSAMGRIAIVDRQQSAFGAGWWLAGLERLHVRTMVWVGGDGSVRQYHPAGTDVWISANVTGPDTLRRDGSHFIRRLPHGLRVKFDGDGRHVQTVNRLGHTTTFAYDGAGRLSTITVPSPGSGAGNFAYGGERSPSTPQAFGVEQRVALAGDASGAGQESAPWGMPDAIEHAMLSTASGPSASTGEAADDRTDARTDATPPVIQPSWSPSDGRSAAVSMNITWCDRESGLDASSRRVWLNDVDVTSGFTYVAQAPNGYCSPSFALSSGMLALQGGANTFRAEIRDQTGNTGVATYTLTYDTTTRVLAYRFLYDGAGKLQEVRTEVNGLVKRATTASVVNGDLQWIRDPDGQTVSFGYRAGGGEAHRIFSRTDKRGARNSFEYDAGWRLRRFARGPGGGADSVITVIEPAETKGLSGTTYGSAQPLASVRTRIDGPRVDVTDTTHLWLNRFGAPARTRNAKGHESLIRYGDDRFPALATRLQQPNGRVVVSYYDARGNVSSTTDLSHLQGGQAATIRHEWDPKWDFVTRTQSATGLVSRLAYDATNGNRLWEQPGEDASRRVHYGYWPNGMLMTVTAPGIASEQVFYDTYGNVRETQTPKRVRTMVLSSDDYGRPVTTRAQVGVGGMHWQETITQYDDMDRVRQTQSIGPAMDSLPPQTVTVQTFLDREGQADSVLRSGSGDIALIGLLKTAWAYDSIGRPVAEIAADGQVAHTWYDAAGNVVRTRRRQANHLDPNQPIRSVGTPDDSLAYDALNQLVRRRTTAVHYKKRVEGIAQRFADKNQPHGQVPAGENPAYPRYSNASDSGLTVAADTAVFEYDAMGNLTRADNRDAWVRRSYYPFGAVHRDSLYVRTGLELSAGGNFTTHQYGLERRYDLDGRQTSLQHPTQLAAGADTNTVTFGYDLLTGALATVTDVMGRQAAYQYNVRGEVERVTLPGGLADEFTYDADGHAATHDTKFDTVFVRRTRVEVDARGKITYLGNAVGKRDTSRFTFSGLGHLTRNWSVAYSVPQGSVHRHATEQHYVNDPLGNVTSEHTVRQYALMPPLCCENLSPETRREQRYEPGTGRQVRGWDPTAPFRVDTLLFDAAGSIVFSTQSYLDVYGNGTADDRASYYGSDGRLAAADHRTVEPGLPPTEWRTVFEEYRYDALGRRVWVRARRFCEDDDRRGECNLSYVRRTVWDGDAELYEIQMPLDSAENDVGPLPTKSMVGVFDPNRSYGRVAYAYGLGIDRPFSVVRFRYADVSDTSGVHVGRHDYPTFAITPLWNLRGRIDDGRFVPAGMPNGSGDICNPGRSTQCVLLAFEGFYEAYGSAFRPAGFFHGSLIHDKLDAAGTLYRRHRTYDPQNGRFTQEDPIGLAGGVNLYGFAAGDPVNFSDPFGLCTPWPDCLLGLGGLQQSLRNVGNAIKDAPRQFAEFWSDGSKGGFVANLAMTPFAIPSGGGGAVFQGGKAALREAIRTGALEGVSGGQTLSILGRLAKGKVDDVLIEAGENGTIRAAFSRRIDGITETTTRVYNRAGEQVNVWIRRANSAGEELY